MDSEALFFRWCRRAAGVLDEARQEDALAGEPAVVEVQHPEAGPVSRRGPEKRRAHERPRGIGLEHRAAHADTVEQRLSGPSPVSGIVGKESADGARDDRRGATSVTGDRPRRVGQRLRRREGARVRLPEDHSRRIGVGPSVVLVPLQAAAHSQELIEDDLVARIVSVVPLGNIEARERQQTSLAHQDANQRAGDALGHRPALQWRVARDARCVALRDDTAIVHDHHGPSAARLRRVRLVERVVQRRFEALRVDRRRRRSRRLPIAQRPRFVRCVTGGCREALSLQLGDRDAVGERATEPGTIDGRSVDTGRFDHRGHGAILAIDVHLTTQLIEPGGLFAEQALRLESGDEHPGADALGDGAGHRARQLDGYLSRRRKNTCERHQCCQDRRSHRSVPVRPIALTGQMQQRLAREVPDAHHDDDRHSQAGGRRSRHR